MHKENTFFEQLCEIELDKIVSNRYQPRKCFADEAIQELAHSIKEVGLLQPPIVTPREELFEIVAGERRVLACRYLGMHAIQAIVRLNTSMHSAKAALVENVQRVDLNPIEIAQSIQRLVQEFSMTQEMVADQIGKERSTVANYVRLLQLPQEMKEALINGKITMAHAKVLLSTNALHRDLLFSAVIREGLTVRKMEERLAKYAKPKKEAVIEKHPCIKDLERKLERCCGAKVEIVQDGPYNGRLVVHYSSLDDLENICQRLETGCFSRS